MCADGSNLHNCANWTCQSTEQIKWVEKSPKSQISTFSHQRSLLADVPEATASMRLSSAMDSLTAPSSATGWTNSSAVSGSFRFHLQLELALYCKTPAYGFNLPVWLVIYAGNTFNYSKQMGGKVLNKGLTVSHLPLKTTYKMRHSGNCGIWSISGLTQIKGQQFVAVFASSNLVWCSIFLCITKQCLTLPQMYWPSVCANEQTASGRARRRICIECKSMHIHSEGERAEEREGEREGEYGEQKAISIWLPFLLGSYANWKSNCF